MTTTGTRWKLERKLALAALVLGALAAFGDPGAGRGSVSLDTQELAALVEGEVDHVSPRELADWIIAQRTDYRLLDVREAAAYGEYHIPTAEHVPMTALADHPLLRNERIVLYSDGGVHSAQAWFFLKARGFPGVYILLGGLDAWIDEVLFPAPPEGEGPETTAEAGRRRAVSELFGGSPRSGEAAGGEPAEIVLPEVEAVAPTVAPRPRKKRKDGC